MWYIHVFGESPDGALILIGFAMRTNSAYASALEAVRILVVEYGHWVLLCNFRIEPLHEAHGRRRAFRY